MTVCHEKKMMMLVVSGHGHPDNHLMSATISTPHPNNTPGDTAPASPLRRRMKALRADVANMGGDRNITPSEYVLRPYIGDRKLYP